jgi:DNA replication protein DnaC
METITATTTTTTSTTITTTTLSDVFKGLGLNTLPQYLPAVLDEARLQQLSYEAFLHQALRVELQGRQQRALERRVRAARLPFPARLETFDFSFQPTVSERLVRELAGLTFMQTATNVVLLGPPGVGKTHLACALALRALEAGYTAMFTTLRQLAVAMMSPGPKGGTAVLRTLSQPKLLVIDEVGYTRLTVEQASALFDLVASRYERGSIILTSNLSFAEWGGLLGDEVLATALLDRLLHHAEVISINGRSYRMRQRMLADQPIEKSEKRERGERRVEKDAGTGTNDGNERSVAGKKGGSNLTA